MACQPEVLKTVPLFSLLDDDERAVLAAQVEVRTFAPRQRVYKKGDPGGLAYVILTGRVRVTTVDEDQQEVVVDEAASGQFFGFASMLEKTAHQTSAIALEESSCLEISRDDIATLLQKKPHAGMDLLTTLGRQFHAAQELVRSRAYRNANEMIEQRATFGDRVADDVVKFGGSWAFIAAFGVVTAVYIVINVMLRDHGWDPYPFILLNLFLSLLAAIQAPVIMMSQNRQDAKDRVRSEADYRVNVKAMVEIAELHEKLDRMRGELNLARIVSNGSAGRPPAA